jgi:hypothetical protein
VAGYPATELPFVVIDRSADLKLIHYQGLSQEAAVLKDHQNQNVYAE